MGDAEDFFTGLGRRGYEPLLQHDAKMRGRQARQFWGDPEFATPGWSAARPT